MIKIQLEIKSCRECPHSSNNQQEHDDPFGSTPSKIYWYCNQGKNTRDRVDIRNSYEISKDCPLQME